MESVILIVHLMVAVALVGTVLLQRSEGGALGMGGGGGGGGGFLSGRGAANLLTRTTAILATIFFVTSITLTLLGKSSTESRSVLDTVSINKDAPAKKPALPALPGGGKTKPADGPVVPLSK